MIHSENSLVDSIVKYIRNNGGSARASDLVADVMGVSNCADSMAVSIVRSGLPADSPIRVDSSGAVTLISAPADDPAIDELEFVVIDLEATSLPSPSNRITEFAAVLVEKGGIVGDYSTLINPEMPIPRYVRRMTGITNEMVKEAPTFNEHVDSILEILGDRVIVAHNSAFDVGLLNAELQRAKGVLIDNRSLCTIRLARALYPGLDRYRLGAVAQYFDIEIEEQHRALADAGAAARIFVRLLEEASRRGMKRWSQLARIAATKKDRKPQ